jgi:hypothetical protein
MAFTPTRLAQAALTTSTTTTLYTVATGKTVIVKQIILANTTSALATATLSLNSFSIMGAVSVAANSTITLDLSQVLNAAEVIQGGSGTASAITCTISGVVFP